MSRPPLLIDRNPTTLDAAIEGALDPLLGRRRPYRTNRFRIYFEAPPGAAERAFGRELFDEFPDFFQRRLRLDRVTVSRDGRREGDGAPYVSFRANVPGPDIHRDVVVRTDMDDRRGFTFQTVMRTADDRGDQLVRASVRAAAALRAQNWVPALVLTNPNLVRQPAFAFVALAMARLSEIDHMPGFAERLASYMVAINKRHFLAGRRSWRVLPARDAGGGRWPSGPDAYFLETAAIERVSRREFLPGVRYFDEQAHAIWTDFCRSYVRRRGFRPIDFVAFEGGVGYEDHVSIRHAEYDTRAACMAGSADISAIHPDLWPPQIGS